MNQVRLLKNLRTTGINLKNRPDYRQGIGANSNARPTLVRILMKVPLTMTYLELVLKASLNSTGGVIRSWLMCILSMSGKFSVHVWSQCGGLNNELSISVH